MNFYQKFQIFPLQIQLNVLIPCLYGDIFQFQGAECLDERSGKTCISEQWDVGIHRRAPDPVTVVKFGIREVLRYVYDHVHAMVPNEVDGGREKAQHHRILGLIREKHPAGTEAGLRLCR